jgi:hypothetical protein
MRTTLLALIALFVLVGCARTPYSWEAADDAARASKARQYYSQPRSGSSSYSPLLLNELNRGFSCNSYSIGYSTQTNCY